MKRKPEIQNEFSLVNFFVLECNLVMGDQKSSFDSKKFVDEVKFDIRYVEDVDDSFGVEFTVKVKRADGLVNIDLVAAGLFKTASPITEEFKNSSLVNTNAPAMVFPFVRSYISNLTTLSGYPNILLPTYNFLDTSKYLDEEE